MAKRKSAAKRPQPRHSKQKQGQSRKLATVVLTMVVRKFERDPDGRLIVADAFECRRIFMHTKEDQVCLLGQKS
jgi:hypothetical protein